MITRSYRKPRRLRVFLCYRWKQLDQFTWWLLDREAR